MTAIVIIPDGTAYSFDPGAYDSLSDALHAGGFDVRIEPRPEQRGGIHQAGADVGVHLLGLVEQASVDVIAGLLVAHLSKRRRERRERQQDRTRVAVIYGPDDQPLRTVRLNEDE